MSCAIRKFGQSPARMGCIGPIVLLITAVLIVIGAMAAFGYYLTHPAETWTLEEES